MTPQLATYPIPVHPLVKKFLAHHYDCSPFRVTNLVNPYASYLYACLDRYDHRDTQKPTEYGKLTEQLTIGVAAWRKRSFASSAISPRKVASFNNFVRQMFFHQLAHEVALRTALGEGLKASIQRILDRYGITEDELQVEIAIRYYYRMRKKLLLEFCPVSPESSAVILSHERDCENRQVESGWRQVA